MMTSTTTATPLTFGRAVRLILKWGGAALLVIAGLIGILVLGVWAYNQVTYETPLSKLDRAILVAPNSPCADPAYPVMVGVVNKSDRTIERIFFRLEARIKGHSTNVLSFETYDSDRIIKPSESFGNCWRVPAFDYLYESRGLNPADLEWSFGSFRVQFAD